MIDTRTKTRLLFIWLVWLHGLLYLQTSRAGLTDDLKTIHHFEIYFLMLAKMLQSIYHNQSLDQPWQIQLIQSSSDQANSYFRVISPLPGCPPKPEARVWLIDQRHQKITCASEEGPTLNAAILDNTIQPLQRSSRNTPQTNLLEVWVRYQPLRQNNNSQLPNFIELSRQNFSLNEENRAGQIRFFCHKIYDKDYIIEVLIELEPAENLPTVHSLGLQNGIVDIPDESYRVFLDLLEQAIQTEIDKFQSFDGSGVITVSLPDIPAKSARIHQINSGTLASEFTVDNYLPGLVLKRFAGFRSRDEALDFLIAHEVTMQVFGELDIETEQTRFLMVSYPNRDSAEHSTNTEPVDPKNYVVYQLKRLTKECEHPKFYIDGFLEQRNETFTQTRDDRKLRHCVRYNEAVGQITAVVIRHVLGTLKHNYDGYTFDIGITPHLDDFVLRFARTTTYSHFTKRKRYTLIQVSNADVFPSPITFFNQPLYSGNGDTHLFEKLLGLNPYLLFQQQRVRVADTKTAITKLLADFADYAGDLSGDYLPELVRRTRQILLHFWRHDPLFSTLYSSFAQSSEALDQTRENHFRLFFNLEELSIDEINQHGRESLNAKKRFMLYRYLLWLAGMKDRTFQSELFTQADYRQNWWISAVDLRHKDELNALLDDRLFEIKANKHPAGSPTMTPAQIKLDNAVERILGNLTPVVESKILRALNWHLEYVNSRTMTPSLHFEQNMMERDCWITAILSKHDKKIIKLASQLRPKQCPREYLRKEPASLNFLQTTTEAIIVNVAGTIILLDQTLSKKHLQQQENPRHTSKKELQICLSPPVANAKLIESGTFIGMPLMRDIIRLSNCWNIPPMNIINRSPMTFLEAYSQSFAITPAVLTDTVNSWYKCFQSIQLPEFVTPYIPFGTYTACALGEDLSTIPTERWAYSNDFFWQNALIQATAILATPQENSGDRRPLVIIDFSNSIGMNSKAPRIIVTSSVRTNNSITAHQRSLPLKQFTSWSRQNNFTCLARLVNSANKDYWFSLSPAGTKPSWTPILLNNHMEMVGVSRQPITANRADSSQQPNAQDQQQAPHTQPAEQRARDILEQSHCHIAHTPYNHFCLFSSLAQLFQIRPQQSLTLGRHIISLLQHVLSQLTSPNNLQCDDLIHGLGRNIFWLALQYPDSKQHLAEQLKSLYLFFPDTTAALISLMGLTDSKLPTSSSQSNLLNTIQHMSNRQRLELLAEIIVSKHFSSVIDLRIAATINDIALSADVVIYHALVEGTLVSVTQQDAHNRLSAELVFVGIGAQAVLQQIRKPSETTLQMVQKLHTVMPGPEMWGDDRMLEELLIPMLNDAGLQLNILLIEPVTASETTSMSGLFFQHTASSPLLLLSQKTVVDLIRQPDSLTLFHGMLQKTPESPHTPEGTHWQPVLPELPTSNSDCNQHNDSPAEQIIDIDVLELDHPQADLQ